MKGLGVQQLTALIELKKSGIVPARDIVMLSTADEESSGEHGIQWMIANHPEDIDAGTCWTKAAWARAMCWPPTSWCSEFRWGTS